MKIRPIGFYMGHILRLLAILMAPPILIALFRREMAAFVGFTVTFVITMLAGLLLLFFRKPEEGGIRPIEGYVTVALGWIFISLFGALPFCISGHIPRFVDAFFEVVSGFTTTGATILADVEAMLWSLLYWRSFAHWIGGMGVLVFVLAIAPLNKGNGESLHLLRAESPGPDVGKLTPTMRHTARLLYLIYVVLTVVLIGFLLAGGMPLFDSVVHAFGTAGTGGFSIKNLSIAAYPSYYLQGVIAVFMALFGVNFNQYYYLITGKRMLALRNEEFRAYVGIMAGATLLIALNIFFSGVYGNAFDALHHSFFQVSSIMTTTGYATANFDKWPELSRLILLGLMVIGASAGSTGGGMKVARIVMLWKSLKVEVKRMLRPRTVKTVMMDGKRVDGSVLRGVYAFAVAYFLIMAVSILIVALDNFDMDTTVSAVFSCMGNIGPGFSVVGPLGNFGGLSDLSKIVLTIDMLLGRLEIFPLVMLFSPAVWRKRG